MYSSHRSSSPAGEGRCRAAGHLPFLLASPLTPVLPLMAAPVKPQSSATAEAMAAAAAWRQGRPSTAKRCCTLGCKASWCRSVLKCWGQMRWPEAVRWADVSASHMPQQAPRVASPQLPPPILTPRQGPQRGWAWRCRACRWSAAVQAGSATAQAAPGTPAGMAWVGEASRRAGHE